jgi:phosphonate transport system permease protein
MSRWLTGRVAIAVLVGLLFISLYRIGLLDLTKVAPAVSNLWEFTGSLLPPNTGVLNTLLEAMLETIEIAFVGTLLGFALALPLAVLGTRTLFPPWISTPTRMLIGAIRTIPSLLWGIVFVIAYGLGPEAGALGVALYTVGFLGKLLYEAFEAVDSEVIEAVEATGTNRIQLISFAVLPESTNALISHLLFMFEYNVRASAIMGFVGAGGIGFYILGYLQLLQYENLMMALVLTFAVVMAIDFLSGRLRALIVPSMQAPRRAPLLAGFTTLWR